jgi:hypothetical protein
MAYASIVAQDVHSSKLGNYLLSQSLDAGTLGHIHLHSDSLTTLLSNSLCRFLRTSQDQVGRADLGTLSGEE